VVQFAVASAGLVSVGMPLSFYGFLLAAFFFIAVADLFCLCWSISRQRLFRRSEIPVSVLPFFALRPGRNLGFLCQFVQLAGKGGLLVISFLSSCGSLFWEL